MGDSGAKLRAAQSGRAAPARHHLLPKTVIPTSWDDILRIHEIGDDITVCVWDGLPTTPLDVTADGPPMFCIGTFIEGEAWMALDNGTPLIATAGTVVVQTGARPVSGRFRMAGGTHVRLVDIRFSPSALIRAGGRPLLSLRGSLLQDCSVPDAGALMGGVRATSAMLRVADEILNCAFDNAEVRRLYLRAKALEALALVLDSVSSAQSEVLSARDRRLLERARQLIETRYDEDWTIPTLARAVGIGEKKLKAGFRAVAGHTVHAFLRDVRLDAAAALLAQGHSVTDAALASGFSSLSHFSKTFREARGVSPSAWGRAQCSR